ncbi:MAG TPA: hypothetical protein DCX95_07775, partial [Elusimicrobia bacterium]|nr:hypothetical protein [Elusimicrobiota bacterium]
MDPEPMQNVFICFKTTKTPGFFKPPEAGFQSICLVLGTTPCPDDRILDFKEPKHLYHPLSETEQLYKRGIEKSKSGLEFQKVAIVIRYLMRT